MRRIYAVIELSEGSSFDPTSEDDLDALAEDLLHITQGVAGAVVYASADDLIEDVREAAQP